MLESSDVEIFGVGELVKWLSKPPEPLAMQIHEPKMKMAPLGGVMVLKAKVAIVLADELAESPTGVPAVGVYRQACSGIRLAVRFVGRD